MIDAILRFNRMTNLESSKNLAGIGALLLMLSAIPAAGTIVGIIGLILLLIGMKGLSEYYQDSSIYRNTLRGVIFFIIGLIAVAFVMVSLIWGGILAGLAFSDGGFGAGMLILGIVLVALVVLFVFYVLAAMHFRRAFSSLAQKTGEHMFETAGLLLFIGAILTIVLVGLVLILVAWIIALIAFFSIKAPVQQYAYGPPPPSSTISQQTTTQYCPNCGAPVKLNTTFCPNCGRQLPT
jgi:uncharacterized membrane protein